MFCSRPGRLSTSLFLLVVAAVLLCLAPSAWAGVIQLTTPDVEGMAMKINDGGNAAGWGGTYLGHYPMNWLLGEPITLSTPGEVADINEAGDMVGSGRDSGESVGYGWVLTNGVLHRLDNPPGFSSGFSPAAINDHGDIAGVSTDGLGNAHPFLLREGQYLDLLPPGCATAWVADLNNADQVLIKGRPDLYSSAGTQSYLWTAGAFTGLGYDGEGFALNNLGQVAGGWSGGHMYAQATIWQDGQRTDLGALGAGSYSVAYGINDAGTVVGMSATSSTSGHRAFLYKDGAMRQLDPPPAFLASPSGEAIYAYDVNSHDEVVGYYSTFSSAAGRQYYPVLWYPDAQGSSSYAFSPDASSGWHNADQSVTLRASGGRSPWTIHYTLNGGSTWSQAVGGELTVSVSDGSHHVLYYVTNVYGNGATTDAGWVNVDTAAPTTTAVAAAVKVGGVASLAYTIQDPLPTCGMADVTIEVLSGRRIVDTVVVGRVITNATQTYGYASPLKKGTYSYRVLAMDIAGNPARLIGSAKLTVR